ncbi:MAG: hypothetical protein FJ290_16005 [Planctomycetes bacterium]|nr:hypothetical protein [Planctomycetota bacterium]
MSRRYTTVIVRCEDLQQRVFLYRYLIEKGVGRREVQVQHSPKGDAKHWVRQQHVIEVRALRKKPHLSIALVTMLDADNRTVAERKEELDAALAASGQERRQLSERIAVLVPRRNIETWIHRLRGNTVNESDSYPRLRGKESRCCEAVREFAWRCPTRMVADDPPSLRDGCEELTRLLSR